MYANGYISREAESQIPSFSSHDEARSWFKGIYGDSFQLTDSEIIEGQKCYFYFLILDESEFLRGQNDLQKNGFMADASKYLGSYQKIEIFEDGRIHIVH
ncbi:hypothetical protein [Bacillus cereus]|uniref:Uncharacterized protein n=1 Tax=Bacillus cereus HuB4-4 TaxID=1053211 RepID=A0A9W5VI77_BACCE|nr:hypothetical protein [Bacillus cereus]EJP81998.1 hypothetical protein IC3_05683 [Bacillus cereus VD142]EOP78891.1 hypothetical protein IGM_06498 [Bacillus cereus HuB4-4]